MNRDCSVCNIKVDKNTYLKNRSVCKSCYNTNRRRNKNSTITQNKNVTSDQQPKIENVNKNNNNRNLTIGFSNCGKAYLMNYILLQNQELNFINTQSLNQYPNVKAQKSDEIQLLENCQNSTVVFDDMLTSKQKSNINLFFRRGRHNIIDVYYISRSYFHLPKK